MKATIVFEKNWNALNSGRYKYIINSGSSRSSKTFSILQIFWLLAWSRPRTKLAVFRNTKKDCKDTVLQDMLKYYPTLPNFEQVVFNKTESIFTFPNGSTINIEGTDDDLKVHGYHSDYLWFNEFYKMPKTTFDQLDMRCTGCVFMDYNPVGRLWSDDLVNQDNAIRIHSTFRDNPMCPEEQRKKILSYEPTEYNIAQRTADNYMWQVYGLGLKAEKPNRIYKNWNTLTEAEFNALPYPNYYGLDFGSKNPTAVTEVKFDGDNTFFVHERLYLGSSDMGDSVGQTLIDLGIDRKLPIVCDSADPLGIQQLLNHQFNAVPAIKGQGSVNSGIKMVQNFNIYYTNTSFNLENEYDEYEWEVVNGVNLDRPLKRNDHLLDSLRYCITFICVSLGIKK